VVTEASRLKWAFCRAPHSCSLTVRADECHDLSLREGEPAAAPPIPRHLSGGVLEGPAATVGDELPAVRPDMEEEIRLGRAGERASELLAANRVDCRLVDLFKPGSDDLRAVERPPGGEHGVVPVQLDGLQQLDVPDRAAEPDCETRSHPVEAALLEEDPFLLGVNELDDVCFGAQPPAGAAR
jgi:hypothetical protein